MPPPIPIQVLQIAPIVGCILGYLSSIGTLNDSILFASVALVMIVFGEMVRRVEVAAAQVKAAVAQLGEVHNVGGSNPQETMRAAARWGSDVLGRVARGEEAAAAVAASALVEMPNSNDGFSDTSSTSSEAEFSGFNMHEHRSHSSWIYNAVRSVTPDHVTSRDIARMATVPEDVPFYGQPLVDARPRACNSPIRLNAGDL